MRVRIADLSVVFIVVYSDRACGTVALGEFDSDRMSVLVHTYCAGLRIHVVIYIVLFSTKDQPESCKSVSSGCPLLTLVSALDCV